MAASSSAQTRALAEAKFKKKELQLREAEKAMAEYVAAGIAAREKTARLRALREAKEAAEAAEGRSQSAEVTDKTARARHKKRET